MQFGVLVQIDGRLLGGMQFVDSCASVVLGCCLGVGWVLFGQCA